MLYCIALPARVLFAIKDYYILAVSFSLAKENIIRHTVYLLFQNKKCRSQVLKINKGLRRRD